MELSMEQRLAIKLYFKAGESVMETLQMLNTSYADRALPRSNVFRWCRRFRDGREDGEDCPRNGRPTECRNDNNVEKISLLLLQNRHISLSTLADEVNIGKDIVRTIVVEDLRKRKICSRFFPQSLTPDQKDRRIAACRDLIATVNSDPDFFKKIVTGDETCFAYDPITKLQSAAWV
jgi:transposase